MRASPAGIACVLVLFLSTIALADEGHKDDPPEDFGGPMSFDIVRIEHDHTAQSPYPRFVRHRVVSAEDLDLNDLREEQVQVRFNFDIDKDKKFERSLVAFLGADGWEGDIWRTGFPFTPFALEPKEWIGFTRVSQPTPEMLEVALPPRMIGLSRTGGSYRWMVEVYRPTYRGFCGPDDTPACYDRSEPLRHEI